MLNRNQNEIEYSNITMPSKSLKAAPMLCSDSIEEEKQSIQDPQLQKFINGAKV